MKIKIRFEITFPNGQRKARYRTLPVDNLSAAAIAREAESEIAWMGLPKGSLVAWEVKA